MAARIASAAEARKLLRSYERGVYTRLEAISLLIQGASACAPEQLAEALPDDWVRTVREQTASPPGSPSDVVFVSGVLGPGFDYEAHSAEMRQTWFDGAWKWNRYFAEPLYGLFCQQGAPRTGKKSSPSEAS